MVLSDLKIMALIPARSGSKTLVDKNIRPMAGHPLIAYSILHAQSVSCIERTVVSTDSQTYADIATQYGAEVPFLRPPEISADLSTDLEAFQHALQWLKEKDGYVPDICVHLRPTYPVRKAKDTEDMIQVLLDHPNIDSVRPIMPASSTPFKMWFRNKDGLIEPVTEQEGLDEAYNLPRQMLPQAYHQTNNVDVVRTSVIVEGHSMTGSNIFGYMMSEKFDIDTEDEFMVAEAQIKKLGLAEKGKK